MRFCGMRPLSFWRTASWYSSFRKNCSQGLQTERKAGTCGQSCGIASMRRPRRSAAAWLPGEVGEDGSVSVRHGLAAFGTMELFRQEGELFFPVRKEELQPGDSVYALLASGDEWYQGHRILGRGYGFPEQKFSLEETGLFWEDFELLVEEAERPGVWRRWEKRSDFSHSGPEDFHYCLDSRSGQVIFGDCEHGMAPEGLIQIVSCSRTQGQSGNVKAEKITRLFPEDGRELTVSNPWDASDGRDEETMEEAFSRIRKQLSQEGYEEITDCYPDSVDRL